MARGLAISGTRGTDWTEGDDLRFYPPLIITQEQLDESLAIIDECLGLLEAELRQKG
ncbi:MAG: hypothetical protein OXI35_03550 [Gemmatimonadota bacterium]|nr:hypothetical protein [Gemmatimonadota bacterium]